MESYATLRGVAPLILIRYLYLGGENESIDDTMAALGVTNRNYFYRARAELYKLGLLTRDGKLTLGPPPKIVPFYVAPSTPAGLDPQPQTVPQRAPEIEPAPEPAPEPDPVDSLIPVGSILSRIVKADALDGSGDRNNRWSPFTARRKAQIAVLQEAFAAFWPDHQLTDANAKSLLNLAGDCAEAVYEAMEVATAKTDLSGHPWYYIRGILRRQAEEEQMGQQGRSGGPSVKLVNLERDDEGAVMMSGPDPVIAAKEAKVRAAMPWLFNREVDDGDDE